MTSNTFTEILSDRHKQQPTGQPSESLPISNPYNTYSESSMESATQFGHQMVSPSNPGPSLVNGLPTSQGPLLGSILNPSNQFEPVTLEHYPNYEYSVIHPEALRRLGLRPRDFPEGHEMINQSSGYPSERFNCFINVTVQIQGDPAARIVDLLVCDDSIKYTGIDLGLGRKFLEMIGTIHQPPYDVSKLEGMLAPQPSAVSSTNSTDGVPTGLPGWPQNEASAYSGGFAGISPGTLPLRTTNCQRRLGS